MVVAADAGLVSNDWRWQHSVLVLVERLVPEPVLELAHAAVFDY